MNIVYLRILLQTNAPRQKVCQRAWQLAYGIGNDRVVHCKKAVQMGFKNVVHGRAGSGSE